MSRLPSKSDLEAWVLATAPDALAYARSMLRDPLAAEDVVQDCFCRLLARAETYDLLRDGRKLMFQAVTNACINRTQRKRLALSLDSADEGEGMHDALPDRTAFSPAQELAGRELQDAITQGLAMLPVAQRAALQMKSLGQSLQEIADALGVTTTNAGVLIHRARTTLSRYLAPYLEEQAE